MRANFCWIRIVKTVFLFFENGSTFLLTGNGIGIEIFLSLGL